MIRKFFHTLFPQKLSVEDQINNHINDQQKKLELAIFRQQLEVVIAKSELHRLNSYQQQLFDLAADQEATKLFFVDGESLAGEKKESNK